MPRKARIDAPGALHHIIIRGIERRKIFFDDFDRDSFVKRLGQILSETGTPCFAWVLIPNHVHLLLRTGVIPIATVMRRLLTGYAVSFNHRHRRHGQLFQNRYKSILCQEELYLLELVRYIHLNPLRARIVKDPEDLDKYPYSGHGVLMNNVKHDWQEVDYILKLFGGTCQEARMRYREFVEKGISEGRRQDLTGGGLVRSAGGWAAVKTMRRSENRVKGDERILGEGNFAENVLKAAQENLEQKHKIQAIGYSFESLVEHVVKLFEISQSDLLAGGKYPKIVKARSLVCFWGSRELGMSTIELAKKLNISQPTASQSVLRGLKIVEEQGLKISD
ncbi:MAG: transposase [Deltaproteobacteria bacterium]|nr:transposase [Deltaproteobacteria bacterium]